MEAIVSIIIPVYNAEQYIKETLDSIINQSYENIEVLMIDDGSSDKSKEICSSYLKDNRFRYIYQENLGAPSARNNGFNYCNGDYVIFFDSDDIFVEDAIEKMIKEIRINNSDVVIGNFSRFGKNTNISKVNKMLKYMSISKFLLYFTPPLPGNKLYKYDFLKKNNLYFDSLKIGQDVNFFYKAIPNIHSYRIINNSVFLYRLSDNSISRSYDNRILEIINSINLIEENYKNNNFQKKYFDYLHLGAMFHINCQISKLSFFVDEKERKKCKEQLINEFSIHTSKLKNNMYIIKYLLMYINKCILKKLGEKEV